MFALVAQFVRKLLQIELLEEFVDGLRTHSDDELLGVAVGEGCIVFQLFVVEYVHILLLRKEVELGDVVALGRTRLEYHILLVVDDVLQLLGGEAEEISDFIGGGTEVPDMGYGDRKGDVAHPLAADLLLRDLHAAAVADDAAVADALVLSAVALIVLGRTEDALAEESVALRLVGTVVDGFRFQDLSGRFLENHIGGSESDYYPVEICLYLVIIFLDRHMQIF